MDAHQISTEEKILAALSHASLILSGFGLVIPALLWGLQRKKSEYVKTQSVQALAYQLFFVIVNFLMTLLMMIAMFAFMFIVISMSKSNPPADWLMPVVIIVPILLIFGFFGIYILIGFIGAVSCLFGKDFRYPLLGSWIENYLHNATPAAASSEVAS